jgi:ATP-dependent helicase HrpB
LHLFEKISRLVIQVFPKHQHDCLVFLPGADDINKAAERLSQHFANEVEVLKLFSELSKNEQQRALLPHPAGKRKIVVATNIAETSLTIEGIELVIDSGVEKRAVFQLNRGISHLQTQKISKASATQRAGRAGRLGPGTCYRLWSEEQHGRLMGQSPAEILQTDISGFVLESAVWGTPIHNLALISQPTEGQLSQAYEYLAQLALLDSKQRITPQGSKAHKLGCQAGVANMIQKSITLSAGHLSLACALAALLENKDPLGFKYGAQLSLRIELLQKQPSHSIWHAIRYWHKRLGCSISAWPIEDIGLLLVAGFPQWVGYRSHSQRYLLANGSGVHLNSDDPLALNQWIIVASMLSTDRVQGDIKVVLAEPLSSGQLDASFNKEIAWHTAVQWDENKQLVTAEQQQKLGHIVIAKRNLPKAKLDELSVVWRQVITDKGVMNLPFGEQALQLIYRIRLAKKMLPNFSWPDVTEQGLLSRLDDWLVPYLSEVYSWQQLSKLSFVKIINADMEWSSQTKLNEFLPQSVKVPSGNHIKLTYYQTDQAKLSVRIQEVYGLTDTLKVANDQIVLQMELLSPAGRPIQTTQDLAGFWQGSYKAVQKEMKGRYQKHFWPDDPATAIATTRSKKKMNNTP